MHILEVVPPNVVEVQLLEDRSFEQIAAVEPEVTLSDDEPFEPQAGQLDVSFPVKFIFRSATLCAIQIAPSGPSRVLEGMMKQSKAFQGTLQDGRTFRTKKALLDRVESFLEDQRDAISALLKKLSSAKQVGQIAIYQQVVLTSASRATSELARRRSCAFWIHVPAREVGSLLIFGMLITASAAVCVSRCLSKGNLKQVTVRRKRLLEHIKPWFGCICFEFTHEECILVKSVFVVLITFLQYSF